MVPKHGVLTTVDKNALTAAIRWLQKRDKSMADVEAEEEKKRVLKFVHALHGIVMSHADIYEQAVKLHTEKKLTSGNIHTFLRCFEVKRFYSHGGMHRQSTSTQEGRRR